MIGLPCAFPQRRLLICARQETTRDNCAQPREKIERPSSLLHWPIHIFPIKHPTKEPTKSRADRPTNDSQQTGTPFHSDFSLGERGRRGGKYERLRLKEAVKEMAVKRKGWSKKSNPVMMYLCLRLMSLVLFLFSNRSMGEGKRVIAKSSIKRAPRVVPVLRRKLWPQISPASAEGCDGGGRALSRDS